MLNKYRIRGCQEGALTFDADWNAAGWQDAEVAEIGHFRPEGSDHRPRTLARLLHSASGLHGIFMVHDQYVRCTRANYFDEVWKDSCVEFFVQPKPEGGYFNLEFNCGGAHLCNYITDPTRLPDGGIAGAQKLPPELGTKIRVKSSLPKLVNPEITEPVKWSVQFYLPYAVLEAYAGPLGSTAGQTWRGNFFKCAEEVSHPHWASWAPVDAFNFHLPHCFGDLVFER
jgi:hypothetical protein